MTSIRFVPRDDYVTATYSDGRVYRARTEDTGDLGFALITGADFGWVREEPNVTPEGYSAFTVDLDNPGGLDAGAFTREVDSWEPVGEGADLAA